METAGLAYDWVIVAYFFLGGLSAGAFLFSTCANYWKKEWQPMARTAALLAPVALAIGMLGLLLHLGQPMRAWRLIRLNPRSAMSWGVWFLNGFFVLSLLYGWSLLRKGVERAKKFAYVGVPFGILTATYTGVLLTQAPGRALWHSALIPVLFLNGALISGTALALLIAAVRRTAAPRAEVGRVLGVLLILEAALAVSEVIVLFNGDALSVVTAGELLAGRFALLFMGVAVLLGTVLPALLLLYGRSSAARQVVASALTLIGVLATRYVVVIGGQVIA